MECDGCKFDYLDAIHYFYNSKNNGERQKWISDSDSTSKNTSIKENTYFLYDLKKQ